MRENADTLTPDELTQGAVLITDADYEAWKQQPDQVAKSAQLNAAAQAAAAASEAAAQQAKIAALVATGITEATAAALLQIQEGK